MKIDKIYPTIYDCQATYRGERNFLDLHNLVMSLYHDIINIDETLSHIEYALASNMYFLNTLEGDNYCELENLENTSSEKLNQKYLEAKNILDNIYKNYR